LPNLEKPPVKPLGRRMKCALVLAICLFTAAQPLHAEQTLETLRSMLMLRASQELCAFAMSEPESIKLTHAVERLQTRLDYASADIQAEYIAVRARMTDLKPDLCKPNGDWAKTYAAALSGLPQ
jgi:hypothetical protein